MKNYLKYEGSEQRNMIDLLQKISFDSKKSDDRLKQTTIKYLKPIVQPHILQDSHQEYAPAFQEQVDRSQKAIMIHQKISNHIYFQDKNHAYYQVEPIHVKQSSQDSIHHSKDSFLHKLQGRQLLQPRVVSSGLMTTRNDRSQQQAFTEFNTPRKYLNLQKLLRDSPKRENIQPKLKEIFRKFKETNKRKPKKKLILSVGGNPHLNRANSLQTIIKDSNMSKDQEHTIDQQPLSSHNGGSKVSLIKQKMQKMIKDSSLAALIRNLSCKSLARNERLQKVEETIVSEQKSQKQTLIYPKEEERKCQVDYTAKLMDQVNDVKMNEIPVPQKVNQAFLRRQRINTIRVLNIQKGKHQQSSTEVLQSNQASPSKDGVFDLEEMLSLDDKAEEPPQKQNPFKPKTAIGVTALQVLRAEMPFSFGLTSTTPRDKQPTIKGIQFSNPQEGSKLSPTQVNKDSQAAHIVVPTQIPIQDQQAIPQQKYSITPRSRYLNRLYKLNHPLKADQLTHNSPLTPSNAFDQESELNYSLSQSLMLSKSEDRSRRYWNMGPSGGDTDKIKDIKSHIVSSNVTISDQQQVTATLDKKKVEMGCTGETSFLFELSNTVNKDSKQMINSLKIDDL